MNDAALHRVLRQTGPRLLDTLVRLPGADLTTLLLEVMRRRVAALAPADVLRRYRADRFTAPGAVSFRTLRRIEDAVLSAVPASYQLITCAPLVPLGTHAVLGELDQNRVVTTVRGSEVAADPTTALALEAAYQRRRDRAGAVRLAAIQRVVRAQVFPPPGQPHFTLLALASAGRDSGGRRFETEQVIEHLRILTTGARAAGHRSVRVRFTPLSPAFRQVVAAVAERLPEQTEEDTTRDGAYYSGLRFAVDVRHDEGWLPVADGGFVDWCGRLLADRRERLLTSGIGIDMLARGFDSDLAAG